GDDSGNITINLQNNGGSPITQMGVVYSLTSPPTLLNTLGGGQINLSIKSGSQNVSLINLSANTTYYLAFFATNALGTVYSNSLTFTSKEISLDDDSDGISDLIEA